MKINKNFLGVGLLVGTLLTVIVILLVVIYEPKTKTADRPDRFKNVRFVDNYDGDTITVNIKGVHPIIGDEIRIRLKGVDTPELNSKSACEKEIAKKAKKLTYDFVSKAKKGPSLENCERGTFFRLLCDVLVDNKNLATYLIDQEVGVLWKQRHGHVWCVD